MPKSNDESDNESEFSDIDYELSQLPESLVDIISIERANELWNKQSGCCYITNIPMSLTMDTIYSIDIAPRRITEPISDANCILVNKGIKTMHADTGLTWTQFRAFLALCANGMD